MCKNAWFSINKCRWKLQNGLMSYLIEYKAYAWVPQLQISFVTSERAESYLHCEIENVQVSKMFI